MTTITRSIVHTPEDGLLRTPATLAVGIYAWLTAVSFGLTVLDMVYARLVPGAPVAFSEVADFLLFVQAVTVLAGLGAVALTWYSKVTSLLLLVSLGTIALGLVAYFLLVPLQLDAAGVGPTLRLGLGGAMSILAFAAFATRRTAAKPDHACHQ